jgi:hypothetical protein
LQGRGGDVIRGCTSSCARDRSLLLHELRLLLLLSLASRAPQLPRTWEQELQLHTNHRRHLLQFFLGPAATLAQISEAAGLLTVQTISPVR